MTLRDPHHLNAQAIVVGMSARVQDAVHVEVKVVELREKRGVGNDLVDFRVALGYPSVKLGHSHFFYS